MPEQLESGNEPSLTGKVVRQLLQRAGPRTPLPYNKLLATGLLIAATAYIVWRIQESPDQSMQFAFNGLPVGAVYALLALDLPPKNRTRHRVRESVQVRVKGERLEQAEALRG